MQNYIEYAIPTSCYSNIVTVTCYCNYIDEDSSCKEEKVEDFILKPEKLMETKKLRAASPLSLSIFWAKKNNNSPWVWGLRPQTQGELLIFFAQKMLSLALHDVSAS